MSNTAFRPEARHAAASTPQPQRARGYGAPKSVSGSAALNEQRPGGSSGTGRGTGHLTLCQFPNSGPRTNPPGCPSRSCSPPSARTPRAKHARALGIEDLGRDCGDRCSATCLLAGIRWLSPPHQRHLRVGRCGAQGPRACRRQVGGDHVVVVEREPASGRAGG